MDTTALLKTLSQANGISGHEAEIASLVLQTWAPFADETHTDKLGNAIVVRHGTDRAGRQPRRIMLASHMDQIGLMVSGIQQGFLRVVALGGVDASVLPGQEVIVHSRWHDLPGLVANTPPHLLKAGDHDKSIPLERMWIDVGLPARQVERLVQIGDLVSLRREVVELRGGLLSGKAFDNRASVAAVTVCLEHLETMQHPWDVVAVATVQEEISLLGASTAAFSLAPDAAIAVDTTYGLQPGSLEVETFELGKGPTIGVGPNVHPRLSSGLRDAAQRIDLETRWEPMNGPSGTDGWAIQVAREGIPTGIVSIPIRSMHTPVETVAVKDVERTGRLLAEFIRGLDEEFYRSLVGYVIDDQSEKLI